ncbi:MAG: DUF3617 family protein [Hyphomicrobium sp.]|jgi:hypothetical protein
MLSRLIVATSILAVGASALSSATATLPKRKPGHWQLTTVAAGTGMTTTDTCVGADDNLAVPADSGDCSEPKVTSAGSEVIVDVVCKRPHGKQIMSTAFGGDFNSRYRAVMKMRFDPPDGYPMVGVTIDGKYIGPDCSPDMADKEKH